MIVITIGLECVISDLDRALFYGLALSVMMLPCEIVTEDVASMNEIYADNCRRIV